MRLTRCTPLVFALLLIAPLALADFPRTNTPLSPANGGRTITTSVLRRGDIIVSTTTKLLSEAIRRRSGTEVSHSILYIGDGQVIEAVGAGVILRPLDEALSDASLAVAFRHPRIRLDQEERIRDFAMSQLGRRFNVWGLISHPRFGVLPGLCDQMPAADRTVCRAWNGLVNIVRRGDNQLFCSQLVFAAYDSANLSLGSIPGASSPGEIPTLNLLESLQYIGHLRHSSSPEPNPRPGPTPRPPR